MKAEQSNDVVAYIKFNTNNTQEQISVAKETAAALKN